MSTVLHFIQVRDKINKLHSRPKGNKSFGRSRKINEKVSKESSASSEENSHSSIEDALSREYICYDQHHLYFNF